MERNVMSLKKHTPISLKKQLKLGDKIRVAMGWTFRNTSGEDVDLDVTLFELNSNGKCPSGTYDDMIFYYHKEDTYAAVVHSPDNRRGTNDINFDAEYIDIDFLRLPKEVSKLAIVVTIDEFEEKKQRFDMVDAAEVRIYDGQGANKQVVAKFNLAEDYSAFTALKVCEFYRSDDEWMINRLSEGMNCGLIKFCKEYGVEDVSE